MVQESQDGEEGLASSTAGTPDATVAGVPLSLLMLISKSTYRAAVEGIGLGVTSASVSPMDHLSASSHML